MKHPCFYPNNSIFTINHQSSPTSNGHVTSIFPRTLQQAIYFPQKSNMSLPFERSLFGEHVYLLWGFDHVRSPSSALNPWQCCTLHGWTRFHYSTHSSPHLSLRINVVAIWKLGYLGCLGCCDVVTESFPTVERWEPANRSRSCFFILPFIPSISPLGKRFLPLHFKSLLLSGYI